jgi:hypothetical protein
LHDEVAERFKTAAAAAAVLSWAARPRMGKPPRASGETRCAGRRPDWPSAQFGWRNFAAGSRLDLCAIPAQRRGTVDSENLSRTRSSSAGDGRGRCRRVADRTRALRRETRSLWPRPSGECGAGPPPRQKRYEVRIVAVFFNLEARCCFCQLQSWSRRDGACRRRRSSVRRLCAWLTFSRAAATGGQRAE